MVHGGPFATEGGHPLSHSIHADFLPLSRRFNSHFPGEPGLASFIEAKGDGSGGDNWSYKTCKAPDKSPPTNQHTMFYRPDALPVAHQQCQSIVLNEVLSTRVIYLKHF